MQVLLVEDNKRLARYLSRALKEEGHVVVTSYDGEEATELAAAGAYDAVVLDLMLPGRPGHEVLASIRRKGGPPVLIISARGEVGDRIQGLDLGADDYLTKPFSVEEFKARVRALLRRQTGPSATTLTCADLKMNLLTRKVTRGTKEIVLTAREFALLEYLMHNQGRTLAKTSIAEHVWGYRFDWESNIIEVFINQLRRKIDRDSSRKLIHTVRGVGYSLRVDGEKS